MIVEIQLGTIEQADRVRSEERTVGPSVHRRTQRALCDLRHRADKVGPASQPVMNENGRPVQIFYYYRVNHRFSVFPSFVDDGFCRRAR